MSNDLFTREQVDRAMAAANIASLENATIGEVVLLAQELERTTGIPFIRMDQGVPGLQPPQIGLEAEKAALDAGVAPIYPAAEGVPALKTEASRFVKAFLDIDVAAASCVPVTGSVCGSFGSFAICNQLDPRRDTVLFIDPGFPIQKSQLRLLGGKWESFDIYHFRGEALRAKLESYLASGNISAIIYSNPNNPAWICLTESELQIIGELATKYDTVILEDLAYFGMDFRGEALRPFRAPYQATVARYTDNYILMISGSKIFSYAGQRVAFVAVSDALFARRFPALAGRYGGTGHFGSTLIGSVLYMITSGVTHSTQYAFAAMLRAATDGGLDFVETTREYARRAEKMKAIFERHGFHVVYDNDLDRPISDGFFFTIGYKDMDGSKLMRELVFNGVSSINLATTGSLQNGIRACVSRMGDEALFALLDERLEAFDKKHKQKE